MVEEIEAGKYEHKKTLKDKIRETVQSRKLGAWMDNTKWQALFSEISKIDSLPIKNKTLFDENEPIDYRTLARDELINAMDYALIEWLGISCVIEKKEYCGQLLSPKTEEFEVKADNEAFLKRYSINYEFDSAVNAFKVWLNRRKSTRFCQKI